MVIAIDYDDTITPDPEMWEAIIKLMQRCGHEVLICTMRKEDHPVHHIPGCLVYYTESRAKLPWLAKRGIHPDIWIDDNPKYVLRDYGFNWEELNG